MAPRLVETANDNPAASVLKQMYEGPRGQTERYGHCDKRGGKEKGESGKVSSQRHLSLVLMEKLTSRKRRMENASRARRCWWEPSTGMQQGPQRNTWKEPPLQRNPTSLGNTAAPRMAQRMMGSHGSPQEQLLHLGSLLVSKETGFTNGHEKISEFSNVGQAKEKQVFLTPFLETAQVPGLLPPRLSP